MSAPSPNRLPDWIKRIALRASAIRVTSPSPAHKWLLLGTTIAIVVVTVVSFRRLDLSLESISWTPLAFALLISALSPLLATSEYLLGLTMSGVSAHWRSALQVSIYGSLANALPAPGGVAVRLRAMTEHGVGASRALRVSLFTGIVWLATSAYLLGLAAAEIRGLALATAVALTAIGVGIGINAKFRLQNILALVGLELVFVLSAALRFYLVIQSLGVDIDPPQAIALAAAGPIASAVGVIPGALGIFEALSAGIAVIVGLQAGIGFLAGLLLRILTFATLLMWIPLLGLTPSVRRTRPDS